MSILAIVLAFFKSLPEILSLVKQIRQHMAEVDKANNEKTTYDRLQIKKSTTADFIKFANDSVRDSISSQTEQFRKDTQSVSTTTEGNSNKIS